MSRVIAMPNDSPMHGAHDISGHIRCEVGSARHMNVMARGGQLATDDASLSLFGNCRYYNLHCSFSEFSLY